MGVYFSLKQVSYPSQFLQCFYSTCCEKGNLKERKNNDIKDVATDFQDIHAEALGEKYPYMIVMMIGTFNLHRNINEIGIITSD